MSVFNIRKKGKDGSNVPFNDMFSVKNQVSIRVEAEEYEREVAPVIVIQTPADPLLRLQVSAPPIVRLSLKRL